MATPALLSSYFFFSPNLRFLIQLLSIVGTSFEVNFSLHILFEVIQYVILPELEPMKINVRVIRVILLYSPPGSVCFK